jgi:hypothetical protein
MLDTLTGWKTKIEFTLKEVSSLHGTLESLSRYNRWGRAWFFALQNAIRSEVIKSYHVLKRWYDSSGRPARLRNALPPSLSDRLSSLVAKDKASLLWNSSAKMPLTAPIHRCIDILYTHLVDPLNLWEQPIAFIVPRVPHAESLEMLVKTVGVATARNFVSSLT